MRLRVHFAKIKNLTIPNHLTNFARKFLAKKIGAAKNNWIDQIKRQGKVKIKTAPSLDSMIGNKTQCWFKILRRQFVFDYITIMIVIMVSEV